MPARLALLLALAVAALVAAVARVAARRETGPTVAAVLRDAGAVREGSAVYHRGRVVGVVDRVARADSGARLAIRMLDPRVDLRAGDLVAHATGDGTAAGAVVIVPSGSPSRPWRPGDVLQPAPAGHHRIRSPIAPSSTTADHAYPHRVPPARRARRRRRARPAGA